MQSEPGCLFWDQKWEISDFDGNNELTIIYKYLPECSCSCDNEVYCDGPCHDSICVWKVKSRGLEVSLSANQRLRHFGCSGTPSTPTVYTAANLQFKQAFDDADLSKVSNDA